jgi:putative oxidoreductase
VALRSGKFSTRRHKASISATSTPNEENAMRKIVMIARILLGLILTVFGLDFFLQIMPELEVSEAGGAFLGALFSTGYVFPAIKAIEIGSGVLLLAGLLVPLALTLLAPIIVNIALYHAFLDANGLVTAIVLVILGSFLGWAYRHSFRGVLEVHAQPDPSVALPGLLPRVVDQGKEAW